MAQKTKLTFVGDIMCEKENLEPLKDHIFPDIFSYVSINSDYLIGNLETPIAGESHVYTNHKWSFNTPDSFLDCLKSLGFNLLSTANNHCLDRGREGLKVTLDTLDSYKLKHTGTYKNKKDSRKIFIDEINGIKIAFLSYTYGTNASFNNNYLRKDRKEMYMVNLFQEQEGALITKHPYLFCRLWNRGKKKIRKLLHLETNTFYRKIDKQIKIATKKADFVVFLLHSGGQYNKQTDQFTISFIDYLNSKGVDLIVTTHPHMIQGAKKFPNGSFATYSLGDFYGHPLSESRMCNPDGKLGDSEYSIMLHVDIEKNNGTRISKISFEIYKITLINGIAYPVSLFELIQQEDNEIVKNKLLQDNAILVGRFLNKPASEIELSKIYFFK